MQRVYCFIFAAIFVPAFAGRYPNDLPQCRAGDSVCLPRVITEIVQGHPKGHAGLSIPPIEPLHINKIEIKQGANSPIAVDLNFKDLDLAGLSKAVITKVVGFGTDPTTSKYEVHATVPRIDVTGTYKINGRVLVLPIQGEGKAKFAFDNANLIVKYKPKLIEKKGQIYIQTERFKLDFDTSRLHINLENLFNGDKALGDNMNLFLNENWHDILNELKPAIVLSIEEIFKGIINRIFSKIPYEDVFLKS